MRIMILVADLGGGGAETQIHNLVSHNQAPNIEYLVAYTKQASDALCSSYPVPTTFISGRGKLAQFWSLRSLVRGRSPHVIMSTNLLLDIFASVLSKLYNCIHVVRESNSAAARTGSFKNWIRLKFCASAHVISNNASGAAMWRDAGNRVVQIDNGVVDGAASVSTTKKHQVVCGGRFIPRKRIVDAIKYFSLSPEFSGYTLIIVGDGPEKKQVLNSIEQFKKSDRSISRAGFLSRADLARVLSESEFFISFSDYEGQPNMVIEALQAGVNIILSRTESHCCLFPEDQVTYVDVNESENLLCRAPIKKLEPKELQQLAQRWQINPMARAYNDVFLGLYETFPRFRGR